MSTVNIGDDIQFTPERGEHISRVLFARPFGSARDGCVISQCRLDCGHEAVVETDSADAPEPGKQMLCWDCTEVVL